MSLLLSSPIIDQHVWFIGIAITAFPHLTEITLCNSYSTALLLMIALTILESVVPQEILKLFYISVKS